MEQSDDSLDEKSEEIKHDPLTNTAKAVKLKHSAARRRRSGRLIDAALAERDEAKANELLALSKPITVSAGEVVRAENDQSCSVALRLKDTLEEPDVIAADASEQRTRLAEDAQVLELALDAAATIRAENSVEKMMAHQMATAHRLAMIFADKAASETDSLKAARLANTAFAASNTFRNLYETLHRVRRGGNQKITVQRVTVNEGANAFIAGNLKAVPSGNNEQ